MTKLGRRLFLSGLGTMTMGSVVATRTLAETKPSQPKESKVGGAETIFDLDNLDERPEIVLSPPTLSYDRAISKTLIQTSVLALEQYQVGENNFQYDGSLVGLASYTQDLDRYSQVASFKVVDDGGRQPVELRLLRSVLSGRRDRPPVYFGFVLKSPQHSILVFRGTQNTSDWLANFRTSQVDYKQGGQTQGRVHAGFKRLYNDLADQVKAAVKGLDPTLPCYITGYSLGGALATFAAADIAAHYPALQAQLRLYSYASPRLGDPDFARFYSQLVPNSYRILNLADAVPMVPPSNTQKQRYVHVGQPWSFVTYRGDVAPNHAADLYRAAIDKDLESQQPLG